MAGLFGKIFNNADNKNRVSRSLPKRADEKMAIVGNKRRGHVRTKGVVALRGFTWFLGMVFFGVIAYVLFFSPFLAIDEISVEGEEKLNHEEILLAVKESMDGKYFDVLHKNNLILADKGRMKSVLTDKFKRIGNVEIAKDFPNKIEVRIKERKSMLIFCDGDNFWIINEKGEAYAEADFVSNELGEEDLIVIKNIDKKNVSREDVFVEDSLMQFAIGIKEGLRSELDIEIEKEYLTPALVSGDLRVKTSEGWRIFFNKDLGNKKTLEMLKVILDENIDQDKRANLEYIDLRINNKAYYKLKKVMEDEEGDGKKESENKD